MKTLIQTTLGLFLGILMTNSVMAAECVPLKLIDSRNAGVTVTGNSCDKKTELAVGSNLELASGSRLWLQFDSGDNLDLIDAQIICQNKSGATVKMNVNAHSPWVDLEKQGFQCKDWNNNRMSCDSTNAGRNSFFCALAEAKQANARTSIALSTSVTMRSLGVADKIINNVKDEIRLCKNLYGVNEPLAVGWTVLSSGAIIDFEIDSKEDDLIHCVEKVITGVNYGELERAARIGTKYLEERPYEAAEAPKKVTINKTLF